MTTNLRQPLILPDSAQWARLLAGPIYTIRPKDCVHARMDIRRAIGISRFAKVYCGLAAG
jgi:hypothetical protein